MASVAKPFFLKLLLFSGNLLFQWLMAQCNDCETKAEYDPSKELIFKFLNLKETKAVLSKECQNAVVRLHNDLAAKINKYGGFVRIAVKNCMDAMTTSPAESQNSMIKSGLDFVNKKIPLDKAITIIVNHTVKRLRRRCRTALAEKTKKTQHRVVQQEITSYEKVRVSLIAIMTSDYTCSRHKRAQSRGWSGTATKLIMWSSKIHLWSACRNLFE